MQDNYSRLAVENLALAFSGRPGNLATDLPAEKDGDGFIFRAFGEVCRISPAGINLSGTRPDGVRALLISLYARNVTSEVCLIEPFRAFKELPDSMPYAGAFVTHTQQRLVPHVERLASRIDRVTAAFNTGTASPATGGDFCLRLQPLPKIWLEFICYLPDEDFPAGVTCLYSQNAHRFLGTDALADVGEYTVQKMVSML